MRFFEVNDALDMRTLVTRRRIPPLAIAAGVALTLLLIAGGAKAAGVLGASCAG